VLPAGRCSDLTDHLITISTLWALPLVLYFTEPRFLNHVPAPTRQDPRRAYGGTGEELRRCCCWRWLVLLLLLLLLPPY
jgi:hypothetical protein